MNAETPADLRQRAASIRQSAQRASGQNYYAEMDAAKQLESRAKHLEKYPQKPVKAKQVDNRKRFYTLLSVGKAQLGWDDEFYYGIWLPMQGATQKDGKYSASTLTIGQLSQAVERMKESGFKPTSKRKVTHNDNDWRSKRIGKLNALWCALFDAGQVNDKSQIACERWCKRHTKKDRMQWAGSHELNTCIEQLKAWAKRTNVELQE